MQKKIFETSTRKGWLTIWECSRFNEEIQRFDNYRYLVVLSGEKDNFDYFKNHLVHKWEESSEQNARMFAQGLYCGIESV